MLNFYKSNSFLIKKNNQKTNKLINYGKRMVTSLDQYETTALQSKQRKDFMDVNLSIMKNIGILKMNREHRYNTLTPSYIKGLSRAIETLNLDDNARVIYMSGQNGEHFSNGTDFRTIMYHKKEENYPKIAEYLNDLYGLQTQIAKNNKPIISVAPGHSFNSGASLFAATTLPMITLGSKLCFNEATFGFVPHGGSSFYLSRLPNEVGTFLALTGLPLIGADSFEFKVADKLVHQSKGFEDILADIFHSLEMPIPNAYLMTNNFENIPWIEHIQEHQKNQIEYLGNDIYEEARKKRKNILFDEFVEPKDNIPSLSATADYKYKKLLQEQAQKVNEEGQPGYLDYQDTVFQNYCDYMLGYIKQHIDHPYSKNVEGFMKHKNDINRCFYPNSVEEIIDLLKQENTPFSKLCLQRMEANSMLSMKISLKMIRDARNKDYKGALETELNVGLNKIEDKDFDLGVTQILMKPSKLSQVIFQLGNPGFQNKITDEQVQSYFRQSKWAKDLNLGIVEKAMLPSRFYYEKFSDQIRLWINETSTAQPEVREFFDFELKEALRSQGIDIRDRALTIKNARDKLYDKEQYQRVQDSYHERLQQVALDEKLRKRYYEQIKTEIEKLEQNNTEFSALVNSKINQIFEDAFLERLEKIYDKSKEVHNLQKRRMYIRLKQFLLKSRILTYANEDFERQYKQIINMPFKEIHLTEKWDQSYRDLEHPDIQKSVLWHLSKAIGRVNITPPELVKEFLTNPNIKDQTTLYTFNKEELIKLRSDILQNPEKYEFILQNQESDMVNDRFTNKLKEKEEYEYWYRIINDGRCPLDSIKYYKELQLYKQFVKDIEKKSLGTLKLTISRLIQDFQNQENVNEVTEFEQNPKENKQQVFKRLMTLINQEENIETQTSIQKNDYLKAPLTHEAKKPLSDIKKMIQELTEQDKELKYLFKTQQESDSNKMIFKLRNELLDELYKLIEVVLLNNIEGKIDHKILEERYAQILKTNQESDQKPLISLQFIDQYLQHSNNKNIIKQAIDLVKPYYFEVINERLEEESRKVFNSVNLNKTKLEFLSFYYMSIEHPEYNTSPLIEKIKTFSYDRERQKYLDMIFPDQNLHFQFKKYISQMGQIQDQQFDQNLSQTEKEQQMTLLAQEAYEGLQTLQTQIKQNEKKFDDQAIKRREEQLKSPFNKNNLDEEMRINPEFNMQNFNEYELDQLLAGIRNSQKLNSYIQDNLDEIQKTFTAYDWLNVISSCINEQGIDVDMTMRYGTEQTGIDYIKHMQQTIGGGSQMNWEHFGQYASFLKGFYESRSQLFEVTDNGAKDLINMQEFMTSQMRMSNLSSEEQARQASIYDMMMKKRFSLDRYQNRSDQLKQKLLSFQQLQDKIQSQQNLKERIVQLSLKAPKQLQSFITQLIGKSISPDLKESQYVDLQKLEQYLIQKRFKDITPQNILDTQRIQQDVKDRLLNSNIPQGNAQQVNLLQQLLQNKVDTLSIFEITTIVDSETFNQQYGAEFAKQFKAILQKLDEQLRFISNDRRKEISLQEFLAKCYHLNSKSMIEFTNDILKNKVLSLIGKEQLKDQQVIDWEYANVRTNPSIHNQQNQLQERQQSKSNKKEQQIQQNVAQQIDKYLLNIKNQNQQQLKNQLTDEQQMTKEERTLYNRIIEDAMQITQMPLDFEPIKAEYENKLLKIYTQTKDKEVQENIEESEPVYDQKEVQQVISQYTEARLKDCLLRGELKDKMNDINNGHIYLKVLKERIADELNLSGPTNIKDLSFQAKMDAKKQVEKDLEFEGRYNTLRVNNLNDIGYDNFEQKLESTKPFSKQEIVDTVQNKQEDQQTLFDQLIADYFLSKRGGYAKSKELIQQLNQQFSKESTIYNEDQPYLTNIKPTQFKEGQAIPSKLVQQRLLKEDEPMINPTDFVPLMELDIATSQAIQNDKCGLGQDLRDDIPVEITKIPDYFSTNDVRKPPKVYVEQKLEQILKEVFDCRKKVEKLMSRRELVSYDKVLAQVIDKDTLINRLKTGSEKDIITIYQVGQMKEMHQEAEGNEEKQQFKQPNNQQSFNESVNNQDSLYKFLAYSGMLEKKRREVFKNNKEAEIDVAFGIHTFEEFYKKELLNESKRKDGKQREYKMDMKDYQPKQNPYLQESAQVKSDQAQMRNEFRNAEEREQDFFKDYEVYQENKKEQQQRTQLFFVLEQFLAKTSQNPDPLNKAQIAIEEYFRNPENTQFFDKNKMQ